MSSGWLAILPPILAIGFVVWRKEVIGALLLGLFSSELIMMLSAGEFSPLAPVLNSSDRITAVFESAGNTRILMFSLLVGALLAFVRESGGVAATVDMLINRRLVKGPRQASLMTMFTGLVLFVESNLSILTAGILSRGLFDRFNMSRARLAYIIDSTSAPVCILILLNGWGAYVLALLADYDLPRSSVSVLWGSVYYNFYALLTLALVFYTSVTNRVHGPLRALEQRQQAARQLDVGAAPEGSAEQGVVAPLETSKARYMLAPLGTMVLGMLAFMYMTGDGDIAQGSGSRSVLYATVMACLVAYVMMIGSRKFNHSTMIEIALKGMAELLPLVCIVLFSLALGASLRALGTGEFVAGIVSAHLPVYLVAPLLFLAGGIISFTTGTSWGTFAILVPMGIPLAAPMGVDPSFLLAAILGGGIFGDHCSPISDTTAVSSLASGSPILEHVETQLPYALAAGAMAVLMYLLLGLL